MKHWYVLHTKPHKEYQVADHLARRRIEAYAPFVPAQRVNPRAAREQPYFPSYIFAHADLDAIGVSAVQWTPGLRRLVEFGGQPAIVPDNFVHEIKRRVDHICEAGGMIYDGLERGVSIKITSGPFAGYEGVFDWRLSGSERVRVLLTLIEKKGCRQPKPRPVPVELNVNSIARVKPNL
jgi:transcriptional antiterminator RfaH